MISLKSEREIELIRKAAEIVHVVLQEIQSAISPGVKTIVLDRIAERIIDERGAIPAFKNYHGFPANICSSINEEVVHGIPSERKLQEGDIVSIDVGVKHEGYYADAARTWPIGTVDKKVLRLIDVTRSSFFHAIGLIHAGSRLGDLSNAVQTYVEGHGYSVVRDFVGHGIGQSMHEEPQIQNFGEKGTGPVLKDGMTLAIEPMVNMGTWRVKILENQWTVVTADDSLSAHYEDTVVVRSDKVEVLT
ncbi:MAG: type I methionyl aminopeptidase [Candidatus Omnitrophica bacterium]|nr:type I methionyl aminopeptidase [Candidatus Omnitrophota bacterium]